MKTRQPGRIVLPAGTYRLTEPILILGQIGCVIEGATAVAAKDDIGDLPTINPDHEGTGAATAADIRSKNIGAAHNHGSIAAKVENGA
jgi:hypothetical protein